MKPCRTSDTARGTESLLHIPLPQMVMWTSPIPKPPTKSPPKPTIKPPIKCSPSYIHRHPSISILSVRRYNITTGTTSHAHMFSKFW